MSEASNESEPTMEEILASIRKIISEDEPEAGAAEQAEEAGGEEEAVPDLSPPEEEPEPLELTQMVNDDGTVVDLRPQGPLASEISEAEAAPQEEPPVELEVEAEAEAESEEIELDAGEEEAEPALEEPAAEEPAAEEPAAEETEPLEAEPEPFAEPPDVPADEHEGIVSAEPAALATAAMAQLSDNLDQSLQSAAASGVADKTLAMLVRETMTPHLKAWLDANLPGLVERIVREEIKKMIKRAEYR